MDPVLSNTALGISAAVIVISFAAVGSALGCGTAACAAVGAWKRNYVQGRPASMMLLTFVGAPLSQTIYGMLLMNQIMNKAPEMWAVCLIIGIVCGCAIATSAVFQGRAAAAACDSFSETGQGFANDLMAIGIIEAVAIFAMLFAFMLLGKVPAAAKAAAEAATALL